jgi:hypothetical protein
MPARANVSILVFFAGSEHPDMFRGATFLENDCHFAMIGIDTSIEAISCEIKLKRRSVQF